MLQLAANLLDQGREFIGGSSPSTIRSTMRLAGAPISPLTRAGVVDVGVERLSSDLAAERTTAGSIPTSRPRDSIPPMVIAPD